MCIPIKWPLCSIQACLQITVSELSIFAMAPAVELSTLRYRGREVASRSHLGQNQTTPADPRNGCPIPSRKKGCEIVLGFFFGAGLGFFFGFLGWYHLPSVCNGLELEFVIFHGICHIWACSPSILYGICHILACSPSILHGISYMWACSPSILYGICHILACSPSILHGMFYMWACSPKYLQMRKLGIR